MKKKLKYNLQIFKKLKRGNYIVTPFHAHKTIKISSNEYLDKYKFIEPITFQKKVSPSSCNDFYSNGYDCNLIQNGEAVIVNWIYGQSVKQNKGIYTIVLTKENDGNCKCRYLGLSKSIDNNKSKPFLFNVYKSFYLNKKMYPLGKLQYNSDFYIPTDTTQSYDPYLMYSYIDHNFYKTNYDDVQYNNPYYTNNLSVRYLYESANILKIRQDLFGYGIKHKSFNAYDFSSVDYDQTPTHIYDDGNNNLLVSNIDTNAIVDTTNMILYLSFDEKFKYKIENQKSYDEIIDYSSYKTNAFSISGSYYKNGFYTSGSSIEPVGTALSCDGYPVYVEHAPHYEFNVDTDYAVSFFISASINTNSPESPYSFIVAKQDYTTNFVKNNISNTIDYKYTKSLTGVYPFSIRLINSGSDSGKLYFSRYGGVNEAYVTSSTYITGSYHHIICQKSGSVFEIYVDGVLNSTGSCVVNGSVYNTSPIFIGALFDTESAYNGLIDELRIYNRSLTISEISSLSNIDFNNLQALQTNKVGNIFYDTGTVVITSVNPKYKNMFLGKSGSLMYESSSIYYGFDATFNSSKAIYQHEIIIPIRSYEFNFSSNPTLKKDNKSNTTEFKPFVSSSEFNVYFTTIGLYNNNYELVAVAKLNTPIPKYQDKDLNIIVRFDTE